MDEYLDSFSHGPVVSKIWLCEELEKILDREHYINPTVNILGGWVNILGFIMQVRRPNYYKEINSYDKDPESTRLSDKLCATWKVEESKINNYTKDVLDINFENNNSFFINCSVDQFEDSTWFNKIPDKSLVCMQTTDIIDSTPWVIKQRTKDINEFIDRYKLNTILYSGSKNIKYGHELYYNRLMLIGYK